MQVATRTLKLTARAALGKSEVTSRKVHRLGEKVRGADGKVRRGLREVFEGSECNLPHQPISKRADMKLNINWKELAKQLPKAIGPMVAGRRETPHLPPDRDFYGQTLLKGRRPTYPLKTIAWLSHSSQMAENYGGDTNALANAIKQAVPITTILGKKGGAAVRARWRIRGARSKPQCRRRLSPPSPVR